MEIGVADERKQQILNAEEITSQYYYPGEQYGGSLYYRVFVEPLQVHFVEVHKNQIYNQNHRHKHVAKRREHYRRGKVLRLENGHLVVEVTRYEHLQSYAHTNGDKRYGEELAVAEPVLFYALLGVEQQQQQR